MGKRAATDYRGAVEIDPNLARAYQGAAWLMATCPDEKFRNQKVALQAAKKAIEIGGDDNARFLDTLAAAYADTGQFERSQGSWLRGPCKSPPKPKLNRSKFASPATRARGSVPLESRRSGETNRQEQADATVRTRQLVSPAT